MSESKRIRVYKNSLGWFKIIGKLFLLSQSGSVAKVHSVGEIAIADLKSDDVAEEDLLRDPVLLFVKADTDDDATVKLMYPDSTINVIEAWKLKSTCTEVIKIFTTDTTVPDANMFLSK